MLRKVSKVVIGLSVTTGAGLGLGMTEVNLIPIRGTMLTLIVALTISVLVIIPGALLSLWWCFHEDLG